MNLAIIVAVSQYQFASPLPGCALDAKRMQQLLQTTGKYHDILLLDANPRTAQMRAALHQWSARFQEQAIDEVFWYFSGHGLYCGDARYCGSEFSHRMPEATSLSNHEVDQYLRSVRPRAVVKVIDACQSGAPYIKGQVSAFRQALERSRLETFISMCSCLRDQSSYANLLGSDFTLAWLQAALHRRSGKVTYRQIEQYLINSFENRIDQTPFFVKQGTGQEVFCHVTPALQELARTFQTIRMNKQAQINRSAHPRLSQPHSIWPGRPSEWPRTPRAV